MKIKIEWIWQAYFLYYIFMTITATVYYFQPDSPINMFYEILIAYNITYLIPYLLNSLAVILNLLSLLPFYLFIRKASFLSGDFWRAFFVLRLFLDLTCRSYEINQVKSFLHHDKTVASYFVFTFIMFNLPSYMAIYLYAFKDRKE